MYDPYGRVTVYAPDDTPIGSTFQSGLPVSWKAHRVETEAPLVYMRNRHYSPGLGRFVSVDRIGVWGDALNLGNALAYPSSNPLLYADPFGLQGTRWVPADIYVPEGGESCISCHEVPGGLRNPDGSFKSTLTRQEWRDMGGSFGFGGFAVAAAAITAVAIAIAIDYCIDEVTGTLGGILRTAAELTRGDALAALLEAVGAIPGVPSPRLGKRSLDSIDEAIDAIRGGSDDALDAAKGGGRGANKLKPDPNATGPHSTWKTDAGGNVTGHAEWKPNPQNPSGFDQVKRVDTQHANPHTHHNKATGEAVPTPHVHETSTPGGVRPARPDELPK
jgi:RHS repeat-associated protein